MDQASLAAKKRAAASAPRIDAPEVLAAAADKTVALHADKLGEEVTPTAEAPAASAESTLPAAATGGMNPEADAKAFLDAAKHTPRFDLVESAKSPPKSASARHDGVETPNFKSGSGYGTARIDESKAETNEIDLNIGGTRVSIHRTPKGHFGVGVSGGKAGERWGASGTVGKSSGEDLTNMGLFGLGDVTVGSEKHGFRIGDIFSTREPRRTGTSNSGNRTHVPYPRRGSERRRWPGSEGTMRPGDRIEFNESAGVVIEVNEHQALVAMDDPIDGSRMIYVDLRKFEENVSEEVRPEGSAKSASTDKAIESRKPAQRKVGSMYPVGSRVENEEQGKGTVMEQGDSASFITFDSGALQWVENRFLVGEGEDTFICGNCSTTVTESNKFCGGCGSKLISEGGIPS